MSVASKVTALLSGLTPEQIRALSPVERQQLSGQCERVLREAIHQEAVNATAPKAGVLARLKDGERSQ